MKRIDLLLLVVCSALAGWSQTVEIYMKNGQKEVYDASTIDRIVFSDSDSSNQDNNDSGEVAIIEANIVGEWEVTYLDADAAFGTLHEKNGVGSRAHFYSNGTWIGGDDSGTWKLNGSSFTMYSNKSMAIPAIYTIVSLTKTTIELQLNYGFLVACVKMKRVNEF